jgi:hypothetical protein
MYTIILIQYLLVQGKSDDCTVHEEQPYVVASPRQQCTTGASFNFLPDATKDGRAAKVDNDEPGGKQTVDL